VNLDAQTPITAQARRAADAAGAAPGLGAIHPAKRAGLLATSQPATFSDCGQPKTCGDPAVGRTRIAWYLPLSASSTLQTPASGAADRYTLDCACLVIGTSS